MMDRSLLSSINSSALNLDNYNERNTKLKTELIQEISRKETLKYKDSENWCWAVLSWTIGATGTLILLANLVLDVLYMFK